VTRPGKLASEAKYEHQRVADRRLKIIATTDRRKIRRAQWAAVDCIVV